MICVCRVGDNDCMAITSGPDEPVCPNCIADGHPDYENYRPHIKPSAAVIRLANPPPLCTYEVTAEGLRAIYRLPPGVE
jgi:hypothetical protein